MTASLFFESRKQAESATAAVTPSISIKALAGHALACKWPLLPWKVQLYAGTESKESQLGLNITCAPLGACH